MKRSLASVVVLGVTLAANDMARAADLYEPPSFESPLVSYELLHAGSLSVGAGFGLLDVDSGSGPNDESYPRIDALGTLNLPLSDAWSVQFDVDGFYNFVRDEPLDRNHVWALLGGAHLSYRDPSRGLLGIFGGGGKADALDFESLDPWPVWFVGGEGQVYVDQTTLYLQAGYMHSDDPQDGGAGGDAIRDAVFVRGVARHFLGENAMLQGEMSYAHGTKCDDFSGEGETAGSCDIFGWGGRYTRALQHEGSTDGIHWFVAYDGVYGVNNTEGDNAFEHVFTAGLQFVFGAPSLMANDRYGATLDLPDFGSWSGLTQTVID